MQLTPGGSFYNTPKKEAAILNPAKEASCSDSGLLRLKLSTGNINMLLSQQFTLLLLSWKMS